MTILELAHGLHPSVAAGVYHERILGLASKGALDRVHRSPKHYRTWVDGAEAEDTVALRFGQLLHAALLEPDRYATDFVVEPVWGDCRKTENKATRDAWREENRGKGQVSAEDARTVDGIAGSVSAHPIARVLLRGGIPELTLRWRDRETGIECKGRADYYIPARRLVVDLKTTEDGRADAFRRSVVRYGYQRQVAHYTDAFATLGQPIDLFLFLAVEKTPPYAVSLFTLDPSAVAKGRASIRQDLETLAECLGRDEWPAYAEGIQPLILPDWAD